MYFLAEYVLQNKIFHYNPATTPVMMLVVAELHKYRPFSSYSTQINLTDRSNT